MIIQKCPICKKDFKTYASNNRKFCSWECFQKSLNKKQKDYCKNCGKEIYVYNKEKNNYCSVKCSSEAHKQKNNIVLFSTHAEIIINHKIHGIQKVLIDLEDVEKCNLYKWRANYQKEINNFYIKSTEKYNGIQKNVLIHRLIMNCPKDKVVDHINHNTLDNRKQNLRICTQIDNMQNMSNNSSGKVGVCYDKRINKWVAYISYKHKRKTLGHFKDINDAIRVRKQAEKEYFGYTQ